mmetsp:Transcript_28884/g.70316  ORF Transcript_28884/g.70316 Transcript_28884/m.70316 type:complete len:429 (-) Transcript_28884:506-1792(-)
MKRGTRLLEPRGGGDVRPLGWPEEEGVREDGPHTEGLLQCDEGDRRVVVVRQHRQHSLDVVEGGEDDAEGDDDAHRREEDQDGEALRPATHPRPAAARRGARLEWRGERLVGDGVVRAAGLGGRLGLVGVAFCGEASREVCERRVGGRGGGAAAAVEGEAEGAAGGEEDGEGEEKGGGERQREADGHRDSDGGGEAHRRDGGDGDAQHAEEAEAERRAGDEHRVPGGGEHDVDGGLDRLPRGHLLAEAREKEERVVDRQRERDGDHERRRLRRDVRAQRDGVHDENGRGDAAGDVHKSAQQQPRVGEHDGQDQQSDGKRHGGGVECGRDAPEDGEGDLREGGDQDLEVVVRGVRRRVVFELVGERLDRLAIVVVADADVVYRLAAAVGDGGHHQSTGTVAVEERVLAEQAERLHKRGERPCERIHIPE